MVVVAALLGAGQGYRLEETGDKVCTLERSTNNGDNCFYEPECENVCHDVMVEVHLFLLLLPLSGNEPSRSFKFHNHGEVLYQGFLLV